MEETPAEPFETILEFRLVTSVCGPNHFEGMDYNRRLEGMIDPSTIQTRLDTLSSIALLFPSRYKHHLLSFPFLATVPIALVLLALTRSNPAAHSPVDHTLLVTILFLCAVLAVAARLFLRRSFNAKQAVALHALQDALEAFNAADAFNCGVFWCASRSNRLSFSVGGTGFLFGRHEEASYDFSVHLKIPAENVLEMAQTHTRAMDLLRGAAVAISLGGVSRVPTYVELAEETFETLPEYQERADNDPQEEVAQVTENDDVIDEVAVYVDDPEVSTITGTGGVRRDAVE
ncbi:hypothetical protein BC830DRAFT_1117425 [Chytriomyces sp. MP71]|nr:hypothetical protein BC830DRAFT_1117425 [Chytriomyces sp. MP71]